MNVWHCELRGEGSSVSQPRGMEQPQQGGDKDGKNTKKDTHMSVLFVIRLGLEPKTPTLKVLCSTS